MKKVDLAELDVIEESVDSGSGFGCGGVCVGVFCGTTCTGFICLVY